MALNVKGFSAAPQLVAGPVTVDPDIVYSGFTTDVSVTVKGARQEMFFLCFAPALEANLGIVHCYCSANDTVIVRLANLSVGNINPASQSFYFLGL